MKQEENELLKDLCVRLPYGVKIKDLSTQADTTIDVLGIKEHFVIVDEYSRFGNVYDSISVEFVKAYLRPLSSMTDKEKDEYTETFDITNPEVDDYDIFQVRMVDWLHKHHFDVRGLIEKGLALEAPEGMYEI